MTRFSKLAAAGASVVMFSLVTGTHANPTQDWIAFYDGPADRQNDGAEAIATDHEGNVIVAGFSLGVVRQGLYSADFLVLKYDPTGALLWEYRYDSGGADVPEAMVLDDQGNIYVTGSAEPGFSEEDIFTIKVSPDGDLIWSALYESTEGYRDVARAIQIAPDGRVVIAGSTAFASSNSERGIAISYDALGNQQWVKNYIGPALGDDLFQGLAIDDDGNTYVTGGSYNGANLDMVVIKYASDGAFVWEQRFDGAASGHDLAHDIVIDAHGDLIVAGRTATGFPTYDDLVVVKYDQSGSMIWSQVVDAGESDYDSLSAMHVDRRGNTFVSTTVDDAGFLYDIVITKIDDAGRPRWQRRWGTPGSYDSVFAITSDATDAVYATGITSRDGAGWDYLTLRYLSDGTLDWETTYDGGRDGDDVALCVTVDERGRTYVSGHYDSGTNNLDFATVCYAQPALFEIALDADPLRIGEITRFSITGAQPGEVVYVGYSLAGVGGGACLPAVGGLCLDLIDPATVLGTAPADASGLAVLDVRVPSTLASGVAVSFQSIIRRGGNGSGSIKSNTVTRLTQE